MFAVEILEAVLSFLLALGPLLRWGVKYFVDLGPWAFWVYIGVLVGILLWAVIIRLTGGKPQGSATWGLERQPEPGQPPKRGLEIHWPKRPRPTRSARLRPRWTVLGAAALTCAAISGCGTWRS